MRQHVTQLDQDHVVLVVHLPRRFDPAVLAMPLLAGLMLLVLPTGVGLIGCAVAAFGWLAWAAGDEGHRLEVRRDRITWDGQEVALARVDDRRLEVDGAIYELRGGLTPRAFRLLQSALAQADALRRIRTPPAPEELARLTDAARTAAPPSLRR